MHLYIQGGKFNYLPIYDLGSDAVCTLPISCSQVLFATAISNLRNDDAVIHVQSTSTNSVTLSLDGVVSDSVKYTNVNLLALCL